VAGGLLLHQVPQGFQRPERQVMNSG
jgi:hypothetical protein